MFKKLILTGLVLVGTSMAYASPSCVDCGPDTYGDTNNYSVMSHNNGAAYLGGSIGQMLAYSGTPSIQKSYFGTIALGYGALAAPRLYLAAEAFAKGYGNINNYSSSTTNLRTDWSYGASVIPGLLITNSVMGYLRFGVIRTHFQRQSTSRNGGQLGLGFQANVQQSLDVRAEYVYSLYSRINNVGRPQGDEVSVGIVYKFPV